MGIHKVQAQVAGKSAHVHACAHMHMCYSPNHVYPSLESCICLPTEKQESEFPHLTLTLAPTRTFPLARAFVAWSNATLPTANQTQARPPMFAGVVYHATR